MKNEFDPNLEADLRDYLHSTIRPPRVPAHTRLRVEWMDGAAIPAARWAPTLPAWLRRRAPALRLAAAAAVVVAVVAGSALAWQTRRTNTAVPASSASAVAAPTPIASIPTGMDVASGVSLDGGGFVYVEGHGLRVTTDFGWKWSAARQVPASDSPEDHWWDVGTLQMLDIGHAWMLAIANGDNSSRVTSYRTLDQGRTWHAAQVTTWDAAPSDTRWRLGGSQHFVDAQRGWILVGQDNAPLGEPSCKRSTTADGGVTWTQPAAAPCVGNASTIRWTTTNVGYVASSDDGTIWTTMDGGWTWQSGRIPDITASAGARVQFVMPDQVKRLQAVVTFLGRAPVQYESGDNGATWHKAFDVVPPSQFGMTPPYRAAVVESVQALSSTHWMAVIDMGPTGLPAIFQTTGSGQDWYGWTDATGNLPSRGEILWWDDQAGMILATEPYCNGQCPKMPAIYVTADGGRDWNVESF